MTFDVPPAVLASVPPLPLEHSGPSLPGGAPDDPFVLAGARIALAGVERAGVREVHAHGIRIAADLRTGIAGLPALAPPAVRITPLVIQRDHRAAGLHLIERVAVAHERPVAFLEWTLARADAAAVVLLVDWRLDLHAIAHSPTLAMTPVVRARENVAIARAAGEPFTACFVLSRVPDAWELADSGGAPDRCGFRVRLEPGAPVRLAVAVAGDAAALRATLDTIANPATLLRSGAALLRRLHRDRISVEASDERVTQAIEWAKVRLDAHVRAAMATGGWHACERSSGARDAALAGIASLAAGEFGAAGDLIDLLRAGEAAPDSDTNAAFLLLCASHLAWTGDIPFLRARWPSVQRALESLHTPSATGAGATPEADVLRELAIAAESIGERKTAAAARAAAGVAITRRSTRAEGPAPDPAAVLRRLGGAGVALAEGRAEEGFRLWREEVDRAFVLAKGAWPPGPDDGAAPPGSCLDHPTSAARVVAVMAYGILGAEADATRHRLRLRTRLPSAWDRLRVANLALGDAAVDIGYDRDGEQFVFTLEQTRGAVPVRAVLEAALPARELREAVIDGAPACLDPRPFGDRLLVPVQLSLERSRTIALRASA